MLQTLDTARSQFESEGYYFSPAPIVAPEFVARVSAHMDDVINGKYDTGTPPPYRNWKVGEKSNTLCKINEAHIADKTIYELITRPELGRLAAEVTGAKMVQVWATQLLLKPPGREDDVKVGWHQDRQYWKYFEGEVFTAWIAISDVTTQSGPMKMVRGSHRWGECEGGDFFNGKMDDQRKALSSRADRVWEEVLAILPPGGVSFHHRLTVHGSGANVSDQPRRSFAIHMRTEKSKPVAGSKEYFVSHLDDPLRAPIIFDER
jgi:ectoine hydroxylase-related dioxygenase (phytanoyl-CoA dioxygenase family)